MLVYNDHSTLKYFLSKKDVKPRFLWWVLLLQELMVDHLSRIEHKSGDDKKQLPLSETLQDDHLIAI